MIVFFLYHVSSGYCFSLSKFYQSFLNIGPPRASLHELPFLPFQAAFQPGQLASVHATCRPAYVSVSSVTFLYAFFFRNSQLLAAWWSLLGGPAWWSLNFTPQLSENVRAFLCLQFDTTALWTIPCRHPFLVPSAVRPGNLLLVIFGTHARIKKTSGFPLYFMLPFVLVFPEPRRLNLITTLRQWPRHSPPASSSTCPAFTAQCLSMECTDLRPHASVHGYSTCWQAPDTAVTYSLHTRTRDLNWCTYMAFE